MGTLYLVATPIGNLEDITIRAIKTLFFVDYIACEDTRRTGQLVKSLESGIKPSPRGHSTELSRGPQTEGNQELGIKGLTIGKRPKLISYYDEVESKRVPEIIGLLIKGKNVALVSNSGTPLISDPGFKLVKECLKRGIKIVSIPGPSAVLAALISSGLPTNQFLFLGYLPPKQSVRRKILQNLLSCFKTSEQIWPTIIFFESPHRLKETLTDLKDVFGDIEIVVARELTKIYEEIYRNKVSEALAYFSIPKGEMVVMFAPI